MGYAYESKGPMFSVIGGNDVAPFHAKDVTAVVEVLNPCTIFNIGCIINNNASSENSTLTITRRILPGSATGNVAVAALTIPYANATKGKIFYCNTANFTPQNANAGDELCFTMSNEGGSIGWLPWIEACPRADVKGNNSDFVALTPA